MSENLKLKNTKWVFFCNKASENINVWEGDTEQKEVLEIYFQKTKFYCMLIFTVQGQLNHKVKLSLLQAMEAHRVARD
jgi:hypothetical protein